MRSDGLEQGGATIAGRSLYEHLWMDDDSRSLIFFFKQKTAYEMPKCLEFRRVLFRSDRRRGRDLARTGRAAPREDGVGGGRRREIGRASCRERVEISVVAVSLKKK